MICGKRGETDHCLCECNKTPSCNYKDKCNWYINGREIVANVLGIDHHIIYTQCHFIGYSSNASFATIISRATGFDVMWLEKAERPLWMEPQKWEDKLNQIPTVFEDNASHKHILVRDAHRLYLPRPRCPECRKKLSLHSHSIWSGWFRDKPRSKSIHQKLFCTKEHGDQWAIKQQNRDNVKTDIQNVIRKWRQRQQEAYRKASKARRLQGIEQSKKSRHLRVLLGKFQKNLHDPVALSSLKEEFARLQSSPE